MGKLPGAEFRVEAIDENTPKEAFWRKRLKDADGIILVQDTVVQEKRETLKLPSSKDASRKTDVKEEKGMTANA